MSIQKLQNFKNFEKFLKFCILYESCALHNFIQKFTAKNHVTRSCVTALVIFITFPCSGITGGALFFNPYPIVTLKYRLHGRLWYLQYSYLDC